MLIISILIVCIRTNIIPCYIRRQPDVRRPEGRRNISQDIHSSVIGISTIEAGSSFCLIPGQSLAIIYSIVTTRRILLVTTTNVLLLLPPPDHRYHRFISSSGRRSGCHTIEITSPLGRVTMSVFHSASIFERRGHQYHQYIYPSPTSTIDIPPRIN